MQDNNRLVTAGHAELARTILVITSLCFYVSWHGSETFTGWMVFRKETHLLVVSQTACLMPRDILGFFATDFAKMSSGKFRQRAVSKCKIVPC